MRETVKTVTIANGASLSGELDLEARVLVGIIMPAAWTAAGLSFAVASATGGTFVPLYDDGGNEVSIAAAYVAASTGIGLTGTKADALSSFRYVKVRSGTVGTPVNQGADRVITLVFKGWGWFAGFDPAG